MNHQESTIMFTRAAAVIALLATTACDPAAHEQRLVDAETTKMFGSLMGQPVSRIVAIMGHPQSTREVLGAKVVRWSTRRGFFTCDLDVGLDAQNNMTDWRFDGNNGGCNNLRLPLFQKL